MANREFQSRIIHKHDAAENWAKATNFIPKQGELIVYDADSEYTYERFKIGDGVTTVTNLPFMPDPADKILVVTATANTDSTFTTDYSSAEIIAHINKGGSTVLLADGMTLPFVMIENGEVGYSLTMVATGSTSEVATIMYEVSGNTATLNRAAYNPALAGYAKITDAAQSPVATAESDDGVAYTATVSGIAELTVGTSFIMVPNTTSASTTPTLDVNGLGVKNIRRRLSNLGTAQQPGYSVNWLASDLPFRLVYDGTYWIVEGQNRPAAADLYGTPAAATKATQDGNGNVIADTYATVEYVDTLIGIILNGAS